MKIDINNRTEIVETRNVYQINLTIDNKKCSLKKEETNAGYDLYVLFPDVGIWLDIYDVRDLELRDVLQTIGFNMHIDLFQKESNNIDFLSLPKPNKLK